MPINERTRYDYVQTTKALVAVTGDSLSTKPTSQCGCQKLDYFAYDQTARNKTPNFHTQELEMNVLIAF